MGGHTLLDESVVFFGSELADPPTRTRRRTCRSCWPAAAAGLRGGRWIKGGNVSHNDLLVSILNLFGDTRTTFGTSQYCTGALSGLT